MARRTRVALAVISGCPAKQGKTRTRARARASGAIFRARWSERLMTFAEYPAASHGRK
jgi:hypothetical protein